MKFNKKYFFGALFFCITCFVCAQTITPHVINSAGGGGQIGSTTNEVYYNIGESVITTASNTNSIITQGFLQPDNVGEFGLTATAFITPNSCADKTDGEIKITTSVSGAANPSDFQISYYWNPASYCSAVNTCSTITNLPSGTYSVLVVSQYIGTGVGQPNDSVSIANIVVNGSTEPCEISIYNGLTPNGDGVNDFFAINNIEEFPDNKVEIFNRWGQKMAEINKYDNLTNNWNGTIGNTSQLAPSGTYFYIIDLGNGTKPIKGWIELTGNK